MSENSAAFSNDPNNVGPITSALSFLIKLDGNGNPLLYISGAASIMDIAVESTGKVNAVCAFYSSGTLGSGTEVTSSGYGVVVYVFSTADLSHIRNFSGAIGQFPSNTRVVSNSAGTVCFALTVTGAYSIYGQSVSPR